MKALLSIILLAVIAGGLYYFFFISKADTVEVTGNIQVSQQGNFDINAPQISPLYMAVVKGTAKNNSNEPLKNIFIKYKVAGKNTSAMIFDLGPGQQIEFITKSVNTRAKNPSYYLDGVQYENYNL